jgi:predicted CopG family antitoxin
MLSIPFYGTLIDGITEEKPRGYWISASLITSKVIFPYYRWQNLLEYINTREILNKIRYLDALKVAIYDNKIDKFLEDFEYGLDEIILNSIINEYIDKKMITVMVKIAVGQSSDKSLEFIKEKIKTYIIWNAQKTKRIINLYRILNVRSYEELVKMMNEKKTLSELLKIFQNKDVINIMKNLQIDKRILYVIENFNETEYKKYEPLQLYMKSS